MIRLSRRRFRERNQGIIGGVTVAVVIALVALALDFGHLPLISNNVTYHADFSDAGDLTSGDQVTVAGVKVGQVTGLSLHGDVVVASLSVQQGLHLGSQTRADTKVLTPIGQEYVELTSLGSGHLGAGGTIPVSRTSMPSTLVGDLNTFSSEAEHYNLAQLAKSLQASGNALATVPASTTARALTGLSRFASVLAGREGELATLVGQGAKLTGVLNQRSGDLIALVTQGNLVLKVLKTRRTIIRQLMTTASSLSNQLDAILVGDRSQITVLLSNLHTVSAVLAKQSTKLSDAIPVLAAFDRYAANASGSGPFVDTVVPASLIPDNIAVQCAKQQPLNTTLGCSA